MATVTPCGPEPGSRHCPHGTTGREVPPRKGDGWVDSPIDMSLPMSTGNQDVILYPTPVCSYLIQIKPALPPLDHSTHIGNGPGHR